MTFRSLSGTDGSKCSSAPGTTTGSGPSTITIAPARPSCTLASSGGCRAIILNFSDLEYMNSGGIGLLVTLLIRVQRQGQRLMAIGLSDHYTHIFELTRLNEAIPVFESEAQALAAAEKS